MRKIRSISMDLVVDWGNDGVSEDSSGSGIEITFSSFETASSTDECNEVYGAFSLFDQKHTTTTTAIILIQRSH
jgi:hypothetical protein